MTHWLTGATARKCHRILKIIPYVNKNASSRKVHETEVETLLKWCDDFGVSGLRRCVLKPGICFAFCHIWWFGLKSFITVIFYWRQRGVRLFRERESGQGPLRGKRSINLNALKITSKNNIRCHILKYGNIQPFVFVFLCWHFSKSRDIVDEY